MRLVWLAAVIVLAVLASIGAGMLRTIPRTAARGLLVLLAVPAYPGAVWATMGLRDTVVNHPFRIPNLVFLPTVLLACLALAAIWRSRRGHEA
jgi:cytochrome bd-type quinol oxidase subunit 2